MQVITGSHLTAVIAKDKDHTKFRVIQKTHFSQLMSFESYILGVLNKMKGLNFYSFNLRE